VVVLPDPFRGMGAWRNSTETQQSSQAPRSGPEVKMEEVVPNMARRGARVRDNPGGGESDPAEGVCKKNSRRLNVMMRSPAL